MFKLKYLVIAMQHANLSWANSLVSKKKKGKTVAVESTLKDKSPKVVESKTETSTTSDSEKPKSKVTVINL